MEATYALHSMCKTKVMYIVLQCIFETFQYLQLTEKGARAAVKRGKAPVRGKGARTKVRKWQSLLKSELLFIYKITCLPFKGYKVSVTAWQMTLFLLKVKWRKKRKELDMIRCRNPGKSTWRIIHHCRNSPNSHPLQLQLHPNLVSVLKWLFVTMHLKISQGIYFQHICATHFMISCRAKA